MITLTAPQRRIVGGHATELLQRAVGVFTPLGRTVLAAGVLAWLIAWRLGWEEFMLVAATCLLLLVAGALFTVGRMNVDMGINMAPSRVVVGQTATGQLSLHNSSAHRLLALRLGLSIGQGSAQFDVPTLAAGQSHDELFAIPTHRRGVITVGPARTMRGDPLGLFRRTLAWPETTDLYVHPMTTALDGVGAGFLRDLEGRTTNDTSTSDVELHTLRDYVPGDDRRLVHWRTSARSGRLMVRQFVDTRRSQVAMLLSGDARDFADDDEFELALSLFASLGIRAVRDQQSLVMMAAGRELNTATAVHVLDGASGISTVGAATSLGESVTRHLRRRGDATLAVLVTGSVTSAPQLRAAAARFGADVKVIVVRAAIGGTSGIRDIGFTRIVTAAALSELPRLLRAVARP